MISRRLELALERLQPSDWNRFEHLCSVFLASEFEEIRTVANASGDEGRDAELFSPKAESNVVIQYSVASDWKGKINKTVRRLKETFPNALVLVYLSNQVIGAEWDELKRNLRKNGLTLDIRDRHWFVERVFLSISRQQAAEELAAIIVDPILSSAGVGPYVQSELSTPEAIAAVTFLGLQWQDDTREKGLTKLAFEALVRAVLVNTSSENRLSREVIHSKVQHIISDHPSSQINNLVDGALKRLGKHTVKHWQKEDEFCLAHDEVQRLVNYRVESALAETNLIVAIHEIAESQTSHSQIDATSKSTFEQTFRMVLDEILFDRSQSFAMAAQSGTLAKLADTDFDSILLSKLAKSSLPKIQGVDWKMLLRNSVQETLISDNPAIHAYLRALSDAYTLLAFLKQTPDVQSAVEKMFSHGMLWLDATVVLPLIADTLAESDESRGRFSRMIDAAIEAGLQLFVTSGVIEEVERHMNRALTCARMSYGHYDGQWDGSIPFLLERYLSSGRSIHSFANWLENFRGESRPLQDIADYLKEQFGINERSLEEEANSSSLDLRHALQQFWYERHRRRNERFGMQLDEATITKLVNHDIECYCGVVQLRHQEHSSPFGYSAWWLTVDRHAFDLKNKLRPLMNEQPPDSPVISADFLVNYLAFGPVRRRVKKTSETFLPLLMILGSTTSFTQDLITEAENIRDRIKDLPERVIRREVRDHLDRAKSNIGAIASMGMDTVDEVIQRDQN